MSESLLGSKHCPATENELGDCSVDIPQKWTTEYVDNLHRARHHYADSIKAITDAHNAVLAAANDQMKPLVDLLLSIKRRERGFASEIDDALAEVDFIGNQERR